MNFKKWNSRTGAAALLFMALMGVFIIMAGITVDYSYMQLIRTEFRTSVDAAAKAGAESLARQGNDEAAIQAALDYAAANKVAGQTVRLRREDVILGRAVGGDSGRWNFQPGLRPFNAVKVDGLSPDINLFFGNLLGTRTFAARLDATAGQESVDVVLSIDRSASMLFDMTGVRDAFAPNHPNLSTFTAWGVAWQHHLSIPHPTGSRWVVIRRAINDFYTEIASSGATPSTGMVTWSSDYVSPYDPTYTARASQLDIPLSGVTPIATQHSMATSVMEDWSNRLLMGNTNMHAGLTHSIQELQGPRSRPTANKVIVLFTDGERTEGAAPSLAAADAKSKGIVIHTVSMLTRQQPELVEIAAMTGGTSYTTNNEAELRSAFRSIAKNLQVVLID